MKSSITISGTGCCLVDQIYPDIDFSSPHLTKYMSKNKGDGGLHPGRLVFSEQFESFSGTDLKSSVKEIAKNRAEPIYNVGGPSIVALIHVAQMIHGMDAQVSFYGARGNDKTGDYLQKWLEETPVNLDHLLPVEGFTPSTIVFSDPVHSDGAGERMFINEIGAAWNFGPSDLDDHFFESDIVVFGGTALVPKLHDGISGLLEKAKSEGCITVVNTVYDFRSELNNPGQPWLLGDSEKSYRHIDLLIMDREEAQHLSGLELLTEAGDYFLEQGVSAYIITNGTEETLCDSNGTLFSIPQQKSFPISEAITKDLSGHEGGDTTGCGDNFVGGVLASMAWQLNAGKSTLDLVDCISWGTASGGFCCFHLGGAFRESEEGDKLKSLRSYYELFRYQIND